LDVILREAHHSCLPCDKTFCLSTVERIGWARAGALTPQLLALRQDFRGQREESLNRCLLRYRDKGQWDRGCRQDFA